MFPSGLLCTCFVKLKIHSLLVSFFFFFPHPLSSNYSFQLDGTLDVTRFDDPISKCKATFARVNIDLFILHLSRFAKINYKCGQSTLSSNM